MNNSSAPAVRKCIGEILACITGVIFSRLSGERPGGEGTPHMKGVGMLVGNFELNP